MPANKHKCEKQEMCDQVWLNSRAGESELKSRGILGASGVGVGKNWPTLTPEAPKM